MMRTFILALALWPLAAGAQLAQPEPDTGWQDKEAVVAPRHLVAAASPLAAEAGREILRAGGSALDAAIAVQLVLGLVEPQSSGIGGGAFLLHWSQSERQLRTYDGREAAPAAARPDRFLGADGRPLAFLEAVASGRSVGVPGVLRALELAHARHGRLPWKRLFGPAIGFAERGFAMSRRLHLLAERDPFLREDPAARNLYYGADRHARPVGATIVNSAYARTLREIASSGADAFYRGPIADEIVHAVRAHRVHDFVRDRPAVERIGPAARDLAQRARVSGIHDRRADRPGMPVGAVVEIARRRILAQERVALGEQVQPPRHREAALGEPDRGPEQPLPGQPPVARVRELERAQNAGHTDRASARDRLEKSERPPVGPEKTIGARRGRGCLAPVVGAQLPLGLRPVQEERAAPYPRGLRLHQAENELHRDRGVERRAAGAQDFAPGFRRQRARRGHQVARRDDRLLVLPSGIGLGLCELRSGRERPERERQDESPHHLI